MDNCIYVFIRVLIMCGGAQSPSWVLQLPQQIEHTPVCYKSPWLTSCADFKYNSESTNSLFSIVLYSKWESILLGSDMGNGSSRSQDFLRQVPGQNKTCIWIYNNLLQRNAKLNSCEHIFEKQLDASPSLDKSKKKLF